MALACAAVACGLSASAEPTAWTSRGIGGGGAQYAPAISPFNPQEFYVACDMSEVFHTLDGGRSWATLDFRQLEGGRLSRVQFTADSNVLFSLDYRRPRHAPARSSDGGRTWALADPSAWPTSRPCFAVYADPGSTSRLFAAAQTTLYFSADGGLSFTGLLNFAGSGAPAGSFPGLRLAGAFFDGTQLFAAFNRGLLVSSDGGTSFAQAALTGIPASEAILSFAGAREGSRTRLYCVTAATNFVYPDPAALPYPAYRGVYALTWGDPAWQSVTAGLPVGPTFGLVASCPTNAYIVWLTGRASTFPFTRICRSTDAGTNWTDTLHIPTNVITGWAGLPSVAKVNFAQTEGLAVDPHDPARALITDSGFTHLTTNGGALWRQVYVDPSTEHPTNAVNPQDASYLGIGFEPTVCGWLTWLDATNLLGGFSDLRLVKSHDAGRTWNFDYSGMTNDETYCIVVHPTSGVVYADCQGATSPYMILGLDDASTDRRFGPVMMSTNRGLTWSNLKHWDGVPVWLELDPLNPSTMYVALMNTTNGGIYRTTNLAAGAAAAWTNLGRHPRANGRAYNIRALRDGSLVTTFSCRQLSNTAFEPSSGVFVWTNGWSDRSASNFWYWTQDVVIDPWDSGQSNWYVTVWNAGSTGAPNPATQGGLYRTSDRGLTWMPVWTNGSAQSVTFSPVNSNELWLTTAGLGLWHCAGIRAANPVFIQDTNYPFSHPFRVFYNPHDSNEVWITSNGNGLRVGRYTNWILNAWASPGGTISPSGSVAVYDGLDAAFAAAPGTYFHVADLLTNGASIGPATGFVWSAVTAPGTVTAVFAANTAPRGTPHPWLALYGLGTNDAAELADDDVDSFRAWEEYIAGTDPTNPASCFQWLELSRAPFPDLGNVLRWPAATGRVYRIDAASEALSGAFTTLASGVKGGTWTDAAPAAAAAYRLQVSLPAN